MTVAKKRTPKPKNKKTRDSYQIQLALNHDLYEWLDARAKTHGSQIIQKEIRTILLKAQAEEKLSSNTQLHRFAQFLDEYGDLHLNNFAKSLHRLIKEFLSFTS